MRTVAVVVTYNSSLHIGSCLTALAGSGVAVRVVDNASSDGTVAVVRRAFPDVEVIANRDNVGFSRAVNQAISGAADADVVLLVNPDSVVPPETVAGLVEHLRTHPGVGIAGPRIRGIDGHAAISAHPFESLVSVVASRFGGSLVPVRLRRLVSGARRRTAYDACRRAAPLPGRVDWLSGACLAVRARLLRGIGGLDERYFLYYEDEELCLQAWRRGYEVAYLPALEATHVGGASSADVGSTWPHLYRSMLIFFARHRRSTYQAVRGVVLLRALIGLALAGVRVGLRRPGGRARGRAWHGVALIAWSGARKALYRRDQTA